ncbi:VOC family protein [Shewanella amazonensis]|uniref:Glyoxalase family protein n=1 Tax=Shewanella amazonensis (strain ATCC BAA-1098 / SB2B) TaxID=326297 RepID=A1S4U1_SHEAM|nr:VOC family protein [Shewanella amazonensis]ABL99397.1 glyoxalase family protein [Shewanella amazonensis SB2B]
MQATQPLVWGEIAVTDMARAIAFYQAQFDVSFRREDMDEVEYAILECSDEKAATIGLMKHPEFKPGQGGACLYLHLTDNLGQLVGKLEHNQVQIVMPPMGIKGGECGYIALFVDSEGNTVGLWSPAL